MFRATDRRNHPTPSCGTTRFAGCAAGLRAKDIVRPAHAHEAGNPAKFVEVLGFTFPRRTNPLHGHVRCSQDVERVCSAPRIVEITPRSPAELPASLGVRQVCARKTSPGLRARMKRVIRRSSSRCWASLFLAGQTRSTVTCAARRTAGVFRATNRRNYLTPSCGTTRFVECAADLRAENIARPARVHEAGHPDCLTALESDAIPGPGDRWLPWASCRIVLASRGEVTLSQAQPP